MTICHRGDVVLVPFDFTDRTGSKMRPALVVSTDHYNKASPDVLLASITGNLQAIPHVGDHLLVDWKRAGLLKPSLVQVKLATVEAAFLGRKLGRLSSRDLHAFEEGLRRAMGL
ncbi:MAG: type II toxin-antitoxin system PemK/MazF family toxin [Candidatus Xenobia bacterium]